MVETLQSLIVYYNTFGTNFWYIKPSISASPYTFVHIRFTARFLADLDLSYLLYVAHAFFKYNSLMPSKILWLQCCGHQLKPSKFFIGSQMFMLTFLSSCLAQNIERSKILPFALLDLYETYIALKDSFKNELFWKNSIRLNQF